MVLHNSTVKITVFRDVLSRIYGTLCGPLKIPAEALVVQPGAHGESLI